MRWQRTTWMVMAQDEEEAEYLFEQGEAEGPESSVDEGHQIVEVTRAK